MLWLLQYNDILQTHDIWCYKMRFLKKIKHFNKYTSLWGHTSSALETEGTVIFEMSYRTFL